MSFVYTKNGASPIGEAPFLICLCMKLWVQVSSRSKSSNVNSGNIVSCSKVYPACTSWSARGWDSDKSCALCSAVRRCPHLCQRGQRRLISHPGKRCSAIMDFGLPSSIVLNTHAIHIPVHPRHAPHTVPLMFPSNT
jgi:hypothetical protein